jgi:hypothetical protein
MRYASSILNIAIFFAINSCTFIRNNNEPAGLKIGIAKVNYTPPVGVDLYGNYRDKDYASRGLHDTLYGKAIVVQGANNEKAAILMVDICTISDSLDNVLRAYISENTGIKTSHILIHATHTHSGPTSDAKAPGVIGYLKNAANAVILANSNLKPGSFAIGRTNESRVSFNRRLKATDGTTHMVWEKFAPGYIVGPLGPVDTELLAVAIAQNGVNTGSIVNFGCHPTTLTGNNWLYSADYPGYISEAIGKLQGPNHLSIFLNAPCGNITQVDYRVGFPDTYQECQRIGYILGVSALEAMSKAETVKGGEVEVSNNKVGLKRITITDEQLNWATGVMEKVKREGMPPLQADGIPDEMFARQWIEMYKNQNKVDSLEVMVVRIGDLAIVGLPGEVFCEFGMEIKAKSPCKNTLVMGLTNYGDYYFPTKESFTQGTKGFIPMVTGYETTPGSTIHEIGAGEKLVESALAQLNILFNR